jgi:hypothetical protein
MTVALSTKLQNTSHKPFPPHLITGWTTAVRFSARSGTFLFASISRSVLGSHYSLIRGRGQLADHSPQTWAEVKNACSCTSTTSIRLHEILLKPRANRTFHSTPHILFLTFDNSIHTCQSKTAISLFKY